MTTITADHLSDISNALFAAALEPGRWVDVLNAFSSALPGTSPHLLGHGILGNEFSVLAPEMDPSYMADYAEHYAPMNVWTPAFETAPVGVSIRGTQYVDDETVEKSAFYHEWLKPQDDVVAAGGAVLFRNQAQACVLGGTFTRKHRETSEDQWMGLVDRVLPQFRSAFEIARIMTDAHLATETGAARGSAVLLLRPDGRLAFANLAGEALLEAGRIVGLDHAGRVLVSSIRGSGLRQPDIRPEQHSDVAYFKDGWTYRMLRRVAGPMAGSGYPPTIGLDGPGLCLVLTPPQDRGSRIERVTHALRLTEAEATVAVGLADGLSVQDIADVRDVSPVTVRNQAKSAAFKCGARRRLDLIRAVERVIQK